MIVKSCDFWGTSTHLLYTPHASLKLRHKNIYVYKQNFGMQVLCKRDKINDNDYCMSIIGRAAFAKCI
jgi:hypothetical protein